MKNIVKVLLPPIDFGWNRVRARCGHAGCHNKLLMRTVPQSRVGIHVRGTWYCSVDCFVEASYEPLTALCAGRIVEMPRNPRLSLGLALLSKGFVSEMELRAATNRSEKTGEDLETALERMGVAGEKQIAAARAAQWGAPVLGLEAGGPMVSADFPRALLDSFTAVPLHYSATARRLLLGFVHRVEHSLLQSIEQVTGCRTEPCFVTRSDFEDQTSRVTSSPEYLEAVIDEPGTPERMARTLGNYALEASAREASFVRCKAWIWARLKGKHRTVDVVFALRNAGRASGSLFFHGDARTLG